MELKTIFSNVEPPNKNVIWLTVIYIQEVPNIII